MLTLMFWWAHVFALIKKDTRWIDNDSKIYIYSIIMANKIYDFNRQIYTNNEL